MKRLIIAAVGIALLASGCATKSKFVYEPTAAGLDKGKGRAVAAVMRMADKRSDSKEFDKYYDGDPVKDIQSMFEQELLLTDAFREVVPVTGTAGPKADLMVDPTLQKLQWQVPDYGAMQVKAFLFGLFTGIIGGTIYGYTDTDVLGESSMHLKVTDVSTGKVILDKSYDGQYQQEIIKFKCDTPETKVLVAEKSLHKTFDSIKAELNLLLGKQGQGVMVQ